MKFSGSYSEKKYGYGVRHIQGVCMFLVMLALFIARSSMAVAVLAMTDTEQNNTSITIYEWNKNIQGLILSSFFWGYFLMQIPSGILAKRYGGKLILLVALLANTAICGLLPILIQVGGWHILCACRVVMGLTQACLFPASHTLLGRWFPAQERTSFTGIVYAGSQLGTIIGMPVSGLLAETVIGWKLIFYAVSGILLLIAGIWYFFAASSPGEHRLITKQEREYIEKGLSYTNKNTRTPWRHILRTKALWAVMITHIGIACGYVLFFVDLPTYLERGLQISLKNSAALSALPYIGMMVGNIASTWISEKIYNRGYLSLIACRRLFNTISLVGMATGLICLSFIGPNYKVLAMAILVTTLTLNGFHAAGFMMAPLDMSPNYAGVMLSISNFAANFGLITTPIVTSVILQNDPTNLSRWRIVFFIIAAISVISNFSFVIFGTSDRQEWDDPNFLDRIKSDPEEMKPALKQEAKEKNKEKLSY